MQKAPLRASRPAPRPGEAASLELSLIGNGSFAALVDGHARVVWCCMPRFDSVPVFAGLVDETPDGVPPNRFAIEIEGHERSEQDYEPGTAVLRTRLFDRDGRALEVSDFAPRFMHHGRLFRPGQLVRRVRPVLGQPRMRIVIHPRAGIQRQGAAVARGSHHLRFVLADQAVRLNTSAPMTYVASGQWFTLDGPLSLALGPDETFDGDIDETTRGFEERTLAEWRAWTRGLALPFDWQDAVIRAAIALKLCQFEETGAIVAAATGGIPEGPGAGGGGDARQAWLCDAHAVVRALNGLAQVGTMERYLRWLFEVVRNARGRSLQACHGVGLEHEPHEQAAEGWAGYRGLGPVRFGLPAWSASGHDAAGQVVAAVAHAFHDQRLERPAGMPEFALLEEVGELAWDQHDKPDGGQWGPHGAGGVHTTSALMGWAACDRLARAGAALGLRKRAQRWSDRAGSIRRRLLEAAWNERRKAYVGTFGGEHLDAGVLLMAETGLVDANEPRFLSTLQAIERHLADGPHLRRHEAADDAAAPAAAWTACSFWRVGALARAGRGTDARRHFEALLACRNGAGLLSATVDPQTGELWGNLPQTAAMAGLVNSALRLSRTWEQFV